MSSKGCTCCPKAEKTPAAFGLRRCGRRLAFLAAIAASCLVPLCAFVWLFWDLPDPVKLAAAAPPPSTLIYDRNGDLLYEMVPADGGRSEPVAFADIPRYLRLATLATEDAGFYSHSGVDARAIARALYYNLRYRRVISGASTITQQVARNLLLRDERDQRSLRRKLREAVLAELIELRYSKDEILGLYLNTTYYGRQTYGVQAAAAAYFGKPVSSLDLSECAFLAGLAQAPSAYDPATGDAWQARRQVVLSLMLRHGFVTAEEEALAGREALQFAPPGHEIRAPHFVMYVRDQLLAIFGPEAIYSGLRVYTTLDLPAQERAESILRRSLASVNREPAVAPFAKANDGAVLALDVQSGAILVMVGSPDYFDDSIAGQVNGVLALRQPGSAIKPVTYAAAFERGLGPATMVTDVPTTFTTAEGQPYTPLNYDLTFHGPVLIREALASSYNVVAVKVLDRIGLPAMLDMARRLGITTFDKADKLGLAATLGGGEVSLLELTNAYSVFARAGSALPVHAIELVTDAKGRVLYQAPSPRPRQVLSPQVAYLITDILSDDKARIPTFGEESVLALSRPAAVKTGTTTDCRDNWTIGYTPQLVVGVWVGNADGSSMGRVSGVAGAAPIWHQVMESMLRRLPLQPFTEPPGMVHVEVCALSGLLAGPDCPERRQEIFIAGTEPRRQCDMHVALETDSRTGYLADASTPAEYRVRSVYVRLPPDALAWGDEHGIPRLPQPAPGSALAQGGAEGLLVIEPVPNSVYRLSPDMPAATQRIAVEAVASGIAAPRSVRLVVDGKVLAELSARPYRALWPLSVGEHTIWAESIAEDGSAQRSGTVRISVLAGS